jgi:hypothetical protein
MRLHGAGFLLQGHRSAKPTPAEWMRQLTGGLQTSPGSPTNPSTRGRASRRVLSQRQSTRGVMPDAAAPEQGLPTRLDDFCRSATVRSSWCQVLAIERSLSNPVAHLGTHQREGAPSPIRRWPRPAETSSKVRAQNEGGNYCKQHDPSSKPRLRRSPPALSPPSRCKAEDMRTPMLEPSLNRRGLCPSIEPRQPARPEAQPARDSPLRHGRTRCGHRGRSHRWPAQAAPSARCR